VTSPGGDHLQADHLVGQVLAEGLTWVDNLLNPNPALQAELAGRNAAGIMLNSNHVSVTAPAVETKYPMEQLASLMTLNFQQFDDVSLMAA